MIKAVVSSAAVFLFAQLARAELLLNDSFNYLDGPLVNVSGGTWMHHSGSTTGEVGVATGRVLLDSSNTEDVSALLPGEPYDASGATNIFYASFTVRITSPPSAGGTYFAHFKDASATGFRGRIWALTGGAAPGKFRLGISSVSGSTIAATISTDLSLDTDYLVVMRLVNSNSVSTLWINPGAESDSGVSTSEGVSGFSVVSYAFREASGEGSLTIDNLRVGTSFPDVVTNAPSLEFPAIASQPAHEAIVEGANANFNVTSTGTQPLHYQWQFTRISDAGAHGTDLPDATNAALVLTNVSFAQAGFYAVTVTNSIGSASSERVILNVFADAAPAFSLLTYNMHGNGVEDWSTNTAHVSAIGRQVKFLQPDIITFQEIPVTNNGTARMADFVAAFLPDYNLATNSTSDGFIRSAILSRFPILSSKSHLHSSDLAPYGYAASDFTRDLFEARIAVPGFPQPLHVFTVHLKAGQDADSSSKRAAEAGAVSNYLVAGYLSTNSLEPYVVSGDMNEDLLHPPATDPQSIQRLLSPATGLQLISPLNPFTDSELTFSIQSAGGLTRRYDYVLPCGLLFSNVVASEVFRTDLLNPVPPELQNYDDRIASDHLPVLVTFADPYARPFHLLSITVSSQAVALSWESVVGRGYEVEASPDMVTWTTVASNLTATGSVFNASVNAPAATEFYRVRREQ